MKTNNVAVTHMVGIGNGVSFEMVRKGAIAGGGEHMFIMKNEEMRKQIIYLLESITSCQIKDFNMEYNTKMIECSYPLIPSVLKKGRENTFFLRFPGAVTEEELVKESIKVNYFDEELNKNIEKVLPLKPTAFLTDLHKFSASKEIDSLMEEKTEEGKLKAIEQSIKYQVLSR